MGDITDEEKLRIATQFMLSSPPGEFNEVVTDVRGLVNDDALLNRNALSTFRTYNTDQMLPIHIPDLEHRVLITTFGEIDIKHYKDPRGGNVIEFDHVKQTIGEIRPMTDAEKCAEGEALRAEVDNHLQAYVNDYYPEGGAAVYAESDGSGITLTLCVSAKKFSSGNFWNGRWRSQWKITVKSGASSAQLAGHIHVNVHYFEDGNVQLNNKVEKSADVSLGDTAASGKAIVDALKKIEHEYQQALNESYYTMSESTFKDLRRKLPIHGNKVNWQQIAHHKLANELGDKQ